MNLQPALQPFVTEYSIGSLLCAVVSTERNPNVVAFSPDRAAPIPACIVRSGTGEHELTRIRRIFP